MVSPSGPFRTGFIPGWFSVNQVNASVITLWLIDWGLEELLYRYFMDVFHCKSKLSVELTV